MHGSNNKLIKLGIVCDQTYSFAISFWHEKRGEHQSVGSEHGTITPEAMCLAISVLAASWKNSVGDAVWNAVRLKEDFHVIGTHRFVVQAVREHRRESRQCFGA